jgi:hypothetical protein
MQTRGSRQLAQPTLQARNDEPAFECADYKRGTDGDWNLQLTWAKVCATKHLKNGVQWK